VAGLAAGCASTTQPSDKAVAANNAAAKEQPFNCVRDTGTRVKRTDDQCVNVAGRSWSKDDIDRTGQVNTAEALRQLDPTIR
jgi:non-ribosomal peptide synthetase component E (peptide arylation enzyme)